jgi:hypothetical protein
MPDIAGLIGFLFFLIFALAISLASALCILLLGRCGWLIRLVWASAALALPVVSYGAILLAVKYDLGRTAEKTAELFMLVGSVLVWTFFAASMPLKKASRQDRGQCDCCDYFSLRAGEESEVCAVCFWTRDTSWVAEAGKPSLANQGLTLREARQNFAAFGACAPQWKGNVLSPSERKKFRYAARSIHS